MKEWKLIGIVLFVVFLVVWPIVYVRNNSGTSVKLVSYYPESVTIGQDAKMMTVDGAQMTQFVLSGVRVIVNGDTLKNVNCEMIKR